MKSICILITMMIVINIAGGNEAFEMDMAKVYRSKLDVDDLKGDLNERV